MTRNSIPAELQKISSTDNDEVKADELKKSLETSGETFYQEKLNELLDACRKNLKNFDEAMVTKAVRLCYDAHKNDRRASGEPYFIHPWAVSLIVAQEIPLDDVSVDVHYFTT